MNYLQETQDEELILEINDITIACWYYGAYFSAHEDMKFHKGGVLTIGKGEIQTISMNHNINTKFSIEA